MRILVVFLLTVASMLFCVCAQTQIAAPSTLPIIKARVFCQGSQPYAALTLPVNTVDQGRPGLLYVGMHDPAMSQANFLRNGAWLNWQSGLFPVYAVMSSGLYSTKLTIPLPPSLIRNDWRLYVGYGALSTASESRVQLAINTVNAAKALNINANISAVDPDHYRRSLIQMDMTENGKYAYVNTGIKNKPNMCSPQAGSGGRY